MSLEPPMTSAALPADLPAAHVRLFPVVATATVLTWAADFLFWNQSAGINVGIFTVLLAAGILSQRPARQIGAGSWAALALLVVAAVQSGIESSFTNGCVLAALLLVLGGGTYYESLAPVWRRWVAQGRAVLMAPGRLAWLTETFLSQRPAGRAQNTSDAMSRTLLVFAPAVVLVIVFMVLLAQGNPIFKDLLGQAGTKTMNWLLKFDWSPWRAVFWLLVGAVVLAFLRPRESDAPTEVRMLGCWHRRDQRLAWLQSVMALTMLNVLFAFVNTVDVLEFFNPAMAQGMSQDQLHEGVNHLIAATVLAALVLAAMFQQQPALTKSRALRGLGHLWIVQNLLLAACVLRRDYLYVLENQLLTEKRIYVVCFLGLVVVGYIFLAVHVQRGSRLAWLLRCNVLATFALFYVLQFCDVAGFASQWGARKSLADPEWNFDARYWSTQGPAAWPAIKAVAEGPVERRERTEARKYLGRIKEDERGRKIDWRAYQWREARIREAVLAAQ